MLYKRRIVQEDVPAETTVVTPVAQPVIERNTTVERDGMSGGTAIAVIFAGLIVLALVFYFAWYQPQTVVTQPAPSTTVIDHDGGAAAQPIVTNPAPTTIINPPATNPTVVNPPANNTTVVNPPAGSSSSTTTDNGDGTSTTTTNTPATTPTAPPDNNGG